MSLIKRQYVDGKTIITADNMNDIQNAIIANEQSIADNAKILSTTSDTANNCVTRLDDYDTYMTRVAYDYSYGNAEFHFQKIGRVIQLWSYFNGVSFPTEFTFDIPKEFTPWFSTIALNTFKGFSPYTHRTDFGIWITRNDVDGGSIDKLKVNGYAETADSAVKCYGFLTYLNAGRYSS